MAFGFFGFNRPGVVFRPGFRAGRRGPGFRRGLYGPRTRRGLYGPY
ncbi:hypothetical protein [Metabacillus sp. RGM 3146]